MRSKAHEAGADLRVLLWDIDGTLIRSARAGSFKDYTVPALESVFGTSGRLAEVHASGMTDLQIAAEALRDEGFTPAQIRARVAEWSARFMLEMERVSALEELFYLLPGVREALTAAARHPHYLSALLTGNIEPAARLKVRLVGLEDFFTLPGAFGDDSHDRRDLPALAAERLHRALGLTLAPAQFIVIGDTPNDIACARHFGARALAVGTGRSSVAAELLACQPDAFLPDLTDTSRFLRTLASLT